MSDIIIETINEEYNNNETKNLNFDEIIDNINNKYLCILKDISEKFKYNDELNHSIEYDIKITKDKLNTNKFQIIDIITNNLLSCLEQISDYNSDYFIYQKDNITKKNGKVYKNKIPKIGVRTSLKRVLKESDNYFSEKIFKEIIELFLLLTIKDNDVILFRDDYINYVKNNFNENKNFNKIIIVFENINNILNSKLEKSKEDNIEDENNEDNDEEKTKKNKKNKNGKNKNKNTDDFIKGLENTKIAQLAKNISEKINVNDFPDLSDPSKFLSSLGNNTEEGSGIQNLLKFVVTEVEDAFKNNNLNEKDLIGEAQNIMGQFQNMSGFDPMSLFKNNKNLDPSKLADIFSNFKK